jgi:uncharacterized delta-60 repeat protein
MAEQFYQDLLQAACSIATHSEANSFLNIPMHLHSPELVSNCLPAYATTASSIAYSNDSTVSSLLKDQASLKRASDATSIVFIDSGVQDYQQLAAGVSADAEVHVLNAAQDAIAQITNTLLGHSGIESIHIVSHGTAGSLQFGSDWLNLYNLQNYASQLQSWQKALTEDADILLYGCNVAQGELGQAFVQRLSQLTRADVAASDDLTGNAANNGDWNLEIVTGEIDSPLAFQESAISAYTLTLRDGDLDTTFGAGGKVITDVGAFDVARSVVIQPDGKILVAGYTADNSNSNNAYSSDFVITRYTSNGNLDTSFGTGGKVVSSFGNSSDSRDFVRSMALQADGKIVVAGSVYQRGYYNYGYSYDAAIARYNSDGSLDTSFGTGGKAIYDANQDEWNSLAIQADGKIVVAGYFSYGAGDDFVVARYTSTGQLDQSFELDGTVTINFDGTSYDRAYGLAIQSDNKIIVVGSTAYPSGPYASYEQNANFALARLNSNGSLDTSFGTGGKVNSFVVGSEFAYSVAVQADGKLVVAGSQTSNNRAVLSRYNSNGSLDNSFGQSGTAQASAHSYNSLTLQSDGKIIAVGQINSNLGLERYNSDGSRDSSFGNYGVGVVDTDFGSYGEAGYGIALQSNGKIVVAGTTDTYSNNANLALARYIIEPLPTVSVNSTSQLEGDYSSTTAYTFTVSLSQASTQTITVDYATVDGSATVADNDYLSYAGTLTFAPGETSKTIAVGVNSDTKYETDETFNLVLRNARGAMLGTGSATGTIRNDDTQPTLEIRNSSVWEGTTSSTASFTVLLSNASYQPVSVNYTTAVGSATIADQDYIETAGNLTFNPGETVKTIAVQVKGDSKYELGESFNVRLSNATNALLNNSTAMGSIFNDDALPTISINNVSQLEGVNGTTSYAFSVNLSNASYDLVRVNYATLDGTATVADGDYVATSGVLTFNPGEVSKTVVVNVNGDNKFEAAQTFKVNLSNASGANISTSSGAGTGTIVNDDNRPTITINSVSQSEGNTGTTASSFIVSLSNATDEVVTVGYTTADGTATALDNDYSATSGTLTFNSGETSKTITVVTNSDTKFETDQTFLVNLSNATNSTIATNSAIGTIVNDDARPTVSINNISQAENNTGTTAYTFTVSLSNASEETVSVEYSTADGTATLTDNDYSAASGVITFASGETTKTITVNSHGDSKFEADQTFLVNLSNATNSTIITATGTGTIINDDARPTVSMVNVSQAEGNDGSVAYAFIASLSNTSDEAVSIDYATADNTATIIDGDYTATNGTLIFDAGETSKTITVFAKGDSKFEADQSFFVNLSNVKHGTISKTNGMGTGTIINDDTRPTISIANVSQAEGDSGTTAYTFVVTLSHVSDETIVVKYGTADGTATSTDADYHATAGTLTFNSGEMSQTLTVLANGDTKLEADQTFLVNLENATNSEIGIGTGIGMIVNDDNRPTIRINTVSQLEGNRAATDYAFTVSLSNATDEIVTVDYVTADGTATTTDNDYSATFGTLTFNSGETSKTVTVSANGDTKFETDQTFLVNLSNASNGTIASGTGTGTMINDDAHPAITISNVSQTEGNTGTTAYTFTVSLSNASDETVSVEYATADGTATVADNDYSATSGLLTFNPGETSKTITVFAKSDTKFETDQTFLVNLNHVSNASLSSSSAVGTIANDDTRPIIGITNVSQIEGSSGATAYTFTVSLSNASDEAVSVNYATADGTATVADNDYSAITGRLDFAPGETHKTITVAVNGDSKFEQNQAFQVNLSDASNGTLSATNGSGLGTITNDDARPTIQINHVTQNEGNSSTTAYTFTVSLSNASDEVVTVNYATADGSGTVANNDYSATAGSLTFNPGETSKTITVAVNGDIRYEADETFFVQLSNASNAVISPTTGRGTGTIVNTDAPPTYNFSAASFSVAEGSGKNTTNVVTVTRSGDTTVASSVDVMLTNGTALAGKDFVAGPVTIQFAAGETSKTVPIQLLGDRFKEADETLSLSFTNFSGASIAGNAQATAILTILNDDIL